MLNYNEIINLYRQYMINYCNSNFLNKYNNFPLNRNNHLWWNWEGKDFPRVISLLEFEDYSKKYCFYSKKLLTINGKNDPELLYIKKENQIDIEYSSDINKYDLHNMDLEQKDFDFVILNQTIEHLYNPNICMKTLNNHMVKDGLLYINAPSINIPHDTPFHYYTGITPIGLITMFIDNGFEVLDAGQWGNTEYVIKLFSEKRWPDYRMLNNPGINEINCPVICWVLGRKI